MDALDLARWQFGITTIYHFLFVPLTIGLSVIVASLQTAWFRTGRTEYLRATKFFGKLFLINFAMGVVTGIVQEFQFGMNWSTYSTFVGDVFGAPLAMEALIAFFLESTFIGLWIFGWDRLRKGVHLACIWAAALGSNLSAYFILAANAWMRNPVGYEVDPATGRARLTDIGAVLANPQAWSTYFHVVAAAFVIAGLFVAAVSAWKLMRERWPRTGDAVPHGSEHELFRKSLRAGLLVTLIAGALVVASGDHQAKLAATYEPMKLASAEALWQTEGSAGFSLFAVGDIQGSRNHINVQIPGVLSFLATGDPWGPVQGIENVQAQYEALYGPGDYRPNIAVLYWSFRMMMGLGLAGVAVAAAGLWLTRRGRLPRHRWMYRVVVAALPAALAGNIFGWILTEMGRQPWTVHGELLTAASVSPGVSLGQVAFSLAAFTLLYGVLAVVEVGLLFRYVKAGPAAAMPYPDPPEPDGPTAAPGERRDPAFGY
ncbi:Cytochrome d ubiquinol oxidase subunit I [Pseudonocardia sp. Ae168_Ps1]|uniref:cytochrome ubiquinol oxidase subunit I n=1 Tax=unclassified Pseudonocardia TaxID=2619320 RepID=UPI00094AE39F|nr:MULTISPECIES: cytochrome ubiquinol oxidase subunit I [unclassified Pseudonocardia]OLL71884.1 Cytochrome d ubiquinol oxidase subunit I [Pseudonocardia sp. Ae150A_Ps1]OLL77852.1 Cytochrome d ubiquinol oxidase subunit I [Pseudonocardia sp. Ae168_Ps1]OLL88024.1 Cytochrome d ubiquinol oxidase subunit I [Pseudonocardia sp. Ae263_Ps1]OLL91950.1 Cytochrome d ubiquinol oxidase subunit I [Pseudonocardia sp. Ae356_Ps1]